MSTVKANHERTELSFSLDGLSAREELLIKSFIRILNHRTLQVWTYSPLPYGQLDGLKADIQIISEDKLPGNIQPESLSQKAILVLGHVNRRLPGFLCLPLNAIEIESELNRVGAQVLSARNSNPQHTSLINRDEAQMLRLIRWPPTNLLGSPARIKLATVMTGKAMTLETLQKHSGQSEQLCRDFLLDLQRMGLLSNLRVDTEHKPKPAAIRSITPPIQLGLLARIRNRLGLGLQNGSNA